MSDMSLIDLFAGIGYMTLDISAVLSVTGSALILLLSLFVRSRKQIPETVWNWSLLGLVYGVLFGVPMLWKREYPATSPWLGLSFYLVVVLFLLSLVLILLSFRVRQARFGR